MENFLAYSLKEIPYIAITLMIAFTCHEFAHAYVAYKFGDHTAKKQGRLTLNPLKHLDPFGTLLIFVAGFGWARPVPVNRFFFKNPRLAGILVSIAGPLSNFLLASLGFFLWYGLTRAGLTANISENFVDFLNLFIQLNIVLFVFNLLPLPPLDGYRILEDLAPNDLRAKMTQLESYAVFIFLIIVITPLSRVTIQPIFQFVIPWMMSGLNNFFQSMFF